MKKIYTIYILFCTLLSIHRPTTPAMRESLTTLTQMTIRYISVNHFSSSNKYTLITKRGITKKINAMNQQFMTLDTKINHFKTEEIDPLIDQTIESFIFEFMNMLDNKPSKKGFEPKIVLQPLPDKIFARKLTRQETINAIKGVTEKVFDPNDQKPLSAYIQEMKSLTDNLDSTEDQKMIDAINFIQANQHRTSIIWDSGFWRQAIQEHELHVIPISSSLRLISKSTLIQVATQKKNLDSEN